VVSRPPFGADVLAWFLLDYKRGYCNYSATAEVILLRSAGIPARLVVGFSQGERAPGQRNVLTVKQNDAHAWPEVYFPGIGWVEFEPTTSLEGITRPSGIAPVISSNPIPASNNSPILDDDIPTPPAFDPTTVPEIDVLPPGNEDQAGAPVFIYVLFGLLIIGLSGFVFWRGQTLHRLLIPLWS
jgi:transglutaminase-like putative cysteine protease